MQRSRATRSGLLLAVITLVAGACSDDPTDSGGPVPAQIQLLSAATQSGTPGWPLPDSVVVQVRDAAGNPLPGVLVTWTAANRGDAIGRTTDTTDAEGRLAAEWTLGVAEGQQTLSVGAGALDPVTVTATATILHATSVTVGRGFACALTEANQTLCWGVNNVGQLGNGTVSDDPVQVPTPVAGNLVFTRLSAGGHACGLTGDGTAYCWGPNLEGETGTGTVSEVVPTPTPVITDLRFTTISAEGLIISNNSTCGLTASGQAWCWGDNHYGKLGNGSTESSPVPVQVQSGVAFDSIWTGYWHVCARAATSGELWCWGEQEDDPGAFGAGPAGLHTTPVPVHPEYRFMQLSLGRNFTCGIATDQSTLCWGANNAGSLGTGSEFESSAVPAPVTGGHTFVSLSSTSFKETHARTADGTVYRWGSSGNDVPGPEPVRVAQVGFTSMDSGSEPLSFDNGSCGIGAGSAVYCVSTLGRVRGVPAP